MSADEPPWGLVVAVSAKARHGVDKTNRESVLLIAGEGVEGDAHRGATVRHRSRRAQHPARANLRQVHLLHAELHDELARDGFSLTPGRMGENITTRGVNLLGLPTGAILRLGGEAVVQLTGLRNPCYQLDQLQPGLMAACLEKTPGGRLVRKAGVMSIVLAGGEVRPGDQIVIDLPAGPRQPLRPV